MHLEKGVKYMEKYKAIVKEDNGKHILCLSAGGNDLDIPLTEDNPNAVKNVFNKLIILLKKGEFEFYMEEVGTDLFFQVSREYILQLNKDLAEVYREMTHYSLTE